MVLLHTLWQGALLVMGLVLVLKRISQQRAQLRYLLAIVALALIVIGGFVTWSALEYEAAELARERSEQIVATAGTGVNAPVELSPAAQASK